MPPKTRAEMEGFATAQGIGQRVRFAWRDAAHPDQENPLWTGTVKSKPSATSLVIHYDGQGAVDFPFPPEEGVLILTMEQVGAAVAPSMVRAAAVQRTNPLNWLQISTWGEYMKDQFTVQMLYQTLRVEARIFPVPELHSKEGRTRAAKSGYYEKQVLVEILEFWIKEHMGPTDNYCIMPAAGVPTHILHRLMALRTANEEGGSLKRYMDKVRQSLQAIPAAFADCVKEAKKAVKKGEEEED